MATVPLTSLTLPIPEPYDKKEDNKQRENFYYALNQILTLGKTAGWEIPDPLDLIPVDSGGSLNTLEEIRDAIQNLQYEDLTFDLGVIKIHIQGRTVSISEL